MMCVREGDQQYGVSEVVVVSVLQFVSRDRLAGSMLHEGGAGVQAIERSGGDWDG